MCFYHILALIVVIALVVLVIYAARTLAQIKKTAQAVEYLALTTAEKVEKTQSTFDLIHNVSSVLDNGLFKALTLGADLARRFKRKPKEDKEEE